MKLSRRTAFTAAAAFAVSTTPVAAQALEATRLSGKLIWPDYSRGHAIFHGDAGHQCMLSISGDEEAARAIVKSGDRAELDARLGPEIEVRALFKAGVRLPVEVAALSVVWRAQI